MGVLAVLIALLATGFLGLIFRLAFGERRGLALGGALAFAEAFLQIANGLLKLFDEAILLRDSFTQLLILKEQFLIRRRVHTDLDSDKPCQLDEIIEIFRARGKMTLNKYRKSLR
jgi:hypothetical protein